MLTPILIAIVVGYVLGALPFGYWVARAKGINIFEHGSKNPGATNVRRVLGSGPGNLVFALDALKGAAAAGWPLLSAFCAPASAENVFGNSSTDAVLFGVISLAAALVGHCFSCFTGFKGGKGVATASGGLIVLMPLSLAIGVAVWTLLFYTTRYVSLASIIAAVSLPISGYFLRYPPLLLGLAALIAVLVAVRHRANIARLLNGTENKFVKKTQVADAPR